MIFHADTTTVKHFPGWSCPGVGRGRRPFATLPMSGRVGNVGCVSQALAGTAVRTIFAGDFATGPRFTTPPSAGVRTCQVVPPAPGSWSRPAPLTPRGPTLVSPQRQPTDHTPTTNGGNSSFPGTVTPRGELSPVNGAGNPRRFLSCTRRQRGCDGVSDPVTSVDRRSPAVGETCGRVG